MFTILLREVGICHISFTASHFFHKGGMVGTLLKCGVQSDGILLYLYLKNINLTRIWCHLFWKYYFHPSDF
jgi:hypothetical protein